MTAITILTTPTMIREKSTRLQMRRAKLDLVGEEGMHYFVIGRRGDLIVRTWPHLQSYEVLSERCGNQQGVQCTAVCIHQPLWPRQRPMPKATTNT